jgi:FAD/FMN-containing dehydrogenase
LISPRGSDGVPINYCDIDLKDYETEYWGENAAKLKSVKKAYDPDNLFRHAQSVTV